MAEIELFAADDQLRVDKLKAAGPPCTAILFKVMEKQRQGSFQ